MALYSSALAAATPDRQSVAAGETFAARIATLSEPGGYFDTDDLISNERSYLHVAPALRQAGLAGTAYIGVGPDTSFSYIAATRPSVAFIIDIRRDNLLLHLLFKALFAESATRIDFLARLIGRTAPADLEAWRRADIGPIVGDLDRASLADAVATRARHGAIESRLKTFGVPLSPTDLATIDRFHRTFEDQRASTSSSRSSAAARRPPIRRFAICCSNGIATAVRPATARARTIFSSSAASRGGTS